MSDTKVKISVLRVFDPKEVFETSPVKRSSPMPPCERHHEGQELTVNLDVEMPEGFCHWAWFTIKSPVRMLMFGGDYPWSEEKGKAVVPPGGVVDHDDLRPVEVELLFDPSR